MLTTGAPVADTGYSVIGRGIDEQQGATGVAGRGAATACPATRVETDHLQLL